MTKLLLTALALLVFVKADAAHAHAGNSGASTTGHSW
jgi:hypothetical protein